MKPYLAHAAAVAIALTPVTAFADPQTLVMEVEGLYCASCPYIAAQAIMAVPSARITDGFYDLNTQLAQFVINYDDALATPEQLLAATTDYGYPARLIDAITPPTSG